MKIDFTEKQLELLKDVLGEYAEECYQAMLEYQHVVVDAEEDFIRREYSSMAQYEENRFTDTKDLLEYIEKYQALMGGRE